MNAVERSEPQAPAEATTPEGRTNEVAKIIRQAADRLEASGMAHDVEAVAAIAGRLRAMADTLQDDMADQLVASVGAIARQSPATLVAGSVMAGFALEGEAASDDPAASRKPGFLEEILRVFREGEADDTGQHTLPIALAAASIAWLLANPSEQEQAHAGTDHLGVPPAGATAPGGLGYFMTLNREEEETIDWGKSAA